MNTFNKHMTLLKHTDGDNPSWTIVFDQLPENLEELAAMAEGSLQRPYNTAALTAAVLCHYPIDSAETIEMLAYLSGPAGFSTYNQQFLADCFREKDYVLRSYFAGAVPENQYQPDLPYTITVYENPYSRNSLDQGYLTLLLKSSGSDTMRHIRLRTKKSTGEWFLNEQMLLADIRKPTAEDPWN